MIRLFDLASVLPDNRLPLLVINSEFGVVNVINDMEDAAEEAKIRRNWIKRKS